MKTLITGGAGYVGSTLASACIDAGIRPIILDDFSNGSREFVANRDLYDGDIADGKLIDEIFANHPDIHNVIHCAAKTSVPLSVAEPLCYYQENVVKSIELVRHLVRNHCKRLMFSSSASIYSAPNDLGVTERSPLSPRSPYAATKAITERFLEDLSAAHGIKVLSLRYFNPIGADPSLRTGHQDPTTGQVMGRLISAWVRSIPFTITGATWKTRDGSAVRDYTHVWDLADAHVRALERFDQLFPGSFGFQALNLGSGSGVTVRELLSAFTCITGDPLLVNESPARPGDVIGCFNASSLAQIMLGWMPQKSLEQSIEDSLRWARKTNG